MAFDVPIQAVLLRPRACPHTHLALALVQCLGPGADDGFEQVAEDGFLFTRAQLAYAADSMTLVHS
jgi:hypothetical protein